MAPVVIDCVCMCAYCVCVCVSLCVCAECLCMCTLMLAAFYLCLFMRLHTREVYIWGLDATL